MPSITKRDDSTHGQYRARVPGDVVERVRGRIVTIDLPAFMSDPAVTAKITLTTHAKVSLRTRNPECCRLRHSVVSARLQELYAAVRTGPTRLTHRQLVGLSKRAYDILAARFGDDPGSRSRWEDMRTRAAVELDDDFNEIWPRGKKPTADPVVDDAMADIANLMFDESVPADQFAPFMAEVRRAIDDATRRLHRAALGDYAPDPAEARFPAAGEKKLPVSLTALFDRWAAETKPSPNTTMTWRGVFKQLRSFLEHDDAGRLTEGDVIRWKDHLLANGRKPKTINDSHLAALRSVLAHARRNKTLASNVAEGVRAAMKSVAGEGALPYDDGEVARLLDIASREANPYKKWLPLLAAATGARIGELAQLHGSHVADVDGVVCIKIEPTEDGGRLKNAASERTVPLHPVVIETGFLAFVQARGTGPLFYSRTSRDDTRRHAAKGVTNHIATWVRSKGFTDPRKAPSHALRHWWKSAAFRAGVQDSVADFIQGHRSPSVAARYRHFDIATLAKAVGAIPLPS